jgi:hypothetical protein
MLLTTNCQRGRLATSQNHKKLDRHMDTRPLPNVRVPILKQRR